MWDLCNEHTYVEGLLIMTANVPVREYCVRRAAYFNNTWFEIPNECALALQT